MMPRAAARARCPRDGRSWRWTSPLKAASTAATSSSMVTSSSALQSPGHCAVARPHHARTEREHSPRRHCTHRIGRMRALHFGQPVVGVLSSSGARSVYSSRAEHLGHAQMRAPGSTGVPAGGAHAALRKRATLSSSPQGCWWRRASARPGGGSRRSGGALCAPGRARRPPPLGNEISSPHAHDPIQHLAVAVLLFAQRRTACRQR